jgi:hypothetical protein
MRTCAENGIAYTGLVAVDDLMAGDLPYGCDAENGHWRSHRISTNYGSVILFGAIR